MVNALDDVLVALTAYGDHDDDEKHAEWATRLAQDAAFKVATQFRTHLVEDDPSSIMDTLRYSKVGCSPTIDGNKLRVSLTASSPIQDFASALNGLHMSDFSPLKKPAPGPPKEQSTQVTTEGSENSKNQLSQVTTEGTEISAKRPAALSLEPAEPTIGGAGGLEERVEALTVEGTAVEERLDDVSTSTKKIPPMPSPGAHIDDLKDEPELS